jgi:hypothetical protein
MKIHALVVLAGCSWTGVPGSGNARTEVRNAPPFSAVDVAGPIDADIAIGPGSRVEITGDDNIVPLITTDVHGDRLEIGTRKNIRPSVHLVARITVPRLTGIGLTGSGDITARGVKTDRLELTLSGSGTIRADGVQADRVGVDLSGSGTIRADGTAREAQVEVLGSGTVTLDQLAAERASVSVSGSGDVAVAAARVLDVSITGSGDVTYRGDPELNKRITGSGSVSKR